MLLEIALGVQVVVNFLGFVGVVYWLVRQIKALRGAVQAQATTITTQAESIKAQGQVLQSLKGLLEILEAVFQSTDEVKMLARLKAYKEFVDSKKEGLLKQHADQTAQLFDLFSQLVPYAPPAHRETLIASTTLPQQFKDTLYRLATAAPYQLPPLVSKVIEILEAQMGGLEEAIQWTEEEFKRITLDLSEAEVATLPRLRERMKDRLELKERGSSPPGQDA